MARRAGLQRLDIHPGSRDEVRRSLNHFERKSAATAAPGSIEWWAHWFLMSESANRTLMNACRVTPSRRAS
jgi:hypothetical protein